MGLFEKKEFLRNRFHWFDLLLGVALLILIIRTVAEVWPSSERKEEALVRLEIMVPGLAADLAAQIAVGQWVKDGTSGEFMGKITQKASATRMEPVGRTEQRSGIDRVARVFGEFNQQALAAAQDLLLVLERTGTIREREGVFFGREAVRSGQERVFHTYYVEFTGRINRMDVVEQ
ncbi:MAG TPA: DUF4330 family protein [Firmicutes bacterium]|nr:DUF4330 family protein [Bacillota bacterium]